MDGPEFDKLARKLTSFTSRRQALGGLLGAAAAVTGLGAAAEAKKNGKGRDAKKGAGKGKGQDAKKGDKGRNPGKDQCASGCAASGGTCLTNGDCPSGTVCEGNECRQTCIFDFQCGGAGDCTGGRCVCSPALNNCPAGSTCSASGRCVRNAGGGGACQTGLNRTACGNPGTNLGVCTVCGANDVCAPVDGRLGGQCRTRAGCGTGSCQFNQICTTLNDNRVCGAYSDGGSFVCRPACPTGLVCQGGDVTPAGGINRTCGAPLCTATSCPAGCCQEQADFQQGILAGCQGSISLNNRFACGGPQTACRNCSIIDPNCACLNGVCTCTTTTTTTTSTTTTSTTSAPQGCGPGTANPCTSGCCAETSPGVFRCESGGAKNACGTGGEVCKKCGGQRKCSGKGTCKKRKN